MSSRERCASGDDCDEANGFGRFGNFCEPHAEQLAALVELRPGPRSKRIVKGTAQCAAPDCRRTAKPGEELCPSHLLSLGPRCLVEGCDHVQRPDKAVCGSHVNGDVDPAVLSAWKAAPPAKPGRKPGSPKTVAA